MSETVVIVTYQSLPTHAETARREIAALVATVVAAEPDCHGIEMLQAEDQPERFMLVERWKDRETFLGPHMQQPHIQSFIQRATTILAGPPEIAFWTAPGASDNPSTPMPLRRPV